MTVATEFAQASRTLRASALIAAYSILLLAISDAESLSMLQ
jgi:hypothetical protein